ncbi:Hsp20/alpha crystallin family protein [Shinella sumterensis]|uniref:Hsp20/alpha crystallin family protein n=1 Tax=Shinella sumterensis TaxID=1967501 RepID=UPI003F877197
MAESATKMPVTKSAPPSKSTEPRPLEGLRRDIDRLFEDFNPFDWHLPSRVLGFDLRRRAQAEWPVLPAMDLVEKNDVYEITAELPGIDEKNVEVRLSNHTLTIKGEKQEEKEEKQKDYFLSERRYGSFQRSFQLPDGVDTDGIDASFANGVLSVTLPKTAEAKQSAKNIPVKSA